MEGTLRSAPREAVLAEAGLCELRRVAESVWVCELKKWLRAPEGDPRRDVAYSAVRRRLVRKTDWRTVAWRLFRELVPDGVGRDVWVLSECPWSVWRGVRRLVDGERADDPCMSRVRAVNVLRGLGTMDWVLYTDSSAVESVRCWGAGVVVTRGDPVLPERVFVGRFAAGLVASSYQAEVLALREALVWLSKCDSAWESAVIVSDSQAVLRAMTDVGIVGVWRMSVALGELV